MKTPDSPETPVCFPVSSMVRYRAKKYWRLAGEHAMMKELQHGPITCGMACTNEFVFNYTAGIFRDTTNFTELDHDVEIVGYGEDEHGVKYWRARNSWGTYWGESGFFKIVRGENNLVIESDCHVMVPDVSDDKFVWDKVHPAYGGSIYGLRPYDQNQIAHIGYPLENSSDISWNNTQHYSHELLHKPKRPMPMKLGSTPTPSNAWIQLVMVALVAGAVSIVAGVVGTSFRRALYERIG
ncbi:hypothetical protein DYB28_007430 [Aphanomyces astaci]|nr:hypothetical protein DYB28_007430 [Aphanomyces astaci]